MDKNKLIETIKTMRRILEILEAGLEDIEIATGLREKEPDAVEEMKKDFPRLQELCVEKSRAGFTEKVREMITKRGFNKLSEVGPAYYQVAQVGGSNVLEVYDLPKIWKILLHLMQR